MSNTQELERFYGSFWNSPAYNSRDPNKDEKPLADAIVRFIKKYVLPAFSNKQGLTILDLGCGRGWLTNILLAYGQAEGIDPVEAAINKARELFPQLNFSVGTTQDLLAKSGAGQFDLIVSSEVIEHVPDPEKAGFMKSIASLLAPSGFVLLTTPRGELHGAWERFYKSSQPIEDWISESALDQLCHSAGLKVVARDRVFLPGHPFNWSSRIAGSRFISFFIRCFPHSKGLLKLRYQWGIHQVALLQRI